MRFLQGTAGWWVSARKWGVPLGVPEERKGGRGFHGGAEGGETGVNPWWKIEGVEAKESDL